MTIEYEIINVQSGKKVASAYTKHCFTNRALKPIQMKRYDGEVHEVFEKMKMDCE